MSTPIKEIRDALYDLVSSIDVSAIIDGWEFTSARPPKDWGFPGFWVEPVNDVTQTLDSITDETTFTFAVSITESYEESEVAEDTTIELADAIRRGLLDAVKSRTPIAEGVFDGNPAGTWAFDQRYGQRVYRIEIPIRITETIFPDLEP
jgi:hypothetical protein